MKLSETLRRACDEMQGCPPSHIAGFEIELFFVELEKLEDEVRRLREENAIQKVSIKDYFKLLGEGLEDCERLIALGKAVEKMPKGCTLDRSAGSSDYWTVYQYTPHCTKRYITAADTPLEALTAAG